VTAEAATRAEQVAALRRLPRPALWVIAARLKTLSLSIAPVAAGTILAAGEGRWRLDVLVGAALAAVAIQIGTNLWNDAADAARGVDTAERLGPPRVTALGLLDGRSVRRAASLAFGFAGLVGLYLTSLGGVAILLIGLLSLLFGYLYSMGPRPLSMTPLGEGLVILFFGVAAVAGTELLHTGVATGRGAWLGALFGLPAAAVLLLNNHRDRRTDAAGGRRTLAIVLGARGTRLLYGLLLLAAALGMAQWLMAGCAVAGLLVIPLAGLALALGYRMWCLPVSAALNDLLPLTALFQLALVAAQGAILALCAS
jgi:1,4-dihydroxy-2-naphthoate octaprenyltransferase